MYLSTEELNTCDIVFAKPVSISTGETETVHGSYLQRLSSDGRTVITGFASHDRHIDTSYCYLFVVWTQTVKELLQVLKILNHYDLLIPRQNYILYASSDENLLSALSDCKEWNILREIAQVVVVESKSNTQTSDVRFLYLSRYNKYVSKTGLTKIGQWKNNQLTPSDCVVFSTVYKSFNGHTFTAVYVPYFPYVLENILANGSTYLSGFEVQLLYAVAEKLDFNINFRHQLNDTWGIIDDASGEWTGMIGDVYQDEADFAFSVITVNEFRKYVVDFSATVDTDCLRFVVPQAPIKPKWMILTLPFTWKVWIGTVVTILIVTVVLYTTAILSDKFFLEVSCFRDFTFAIMSITSAIFQVSMTKDSRRSSTRILLAAFWIFTVILTIGYRAMLVSLLNIPLFYTPINTLEDLASSDLTPNMANYGGAWTQFFNSTEDPVYMEIWKRMQYIDIDDVPEAIERVKETLRHALLELDIWIQISVASEHYDPINNVNEVHLVENCFCPQILAWPVTKHANFKESMDAVITRMVETGHILKWKNDIKSGI